MKKFLGMIDLVEIYIKRPLESIKRKQGKLKDKATISFRKKKVKNNIIIVYCNAQLRIIFAYKQ